MKDYLELYQGHNLEELKRLAEQYPQAMMALGERYWAQGKSDEAITCFRTVINRQQSENTSGETRSDVRKHQINAHLALGEIGEHLGEVAKAKGISVIDEYKQAFLDGSDKAAYHIAKLLTAKKALTNAAEWWLIALDDKDNRAINDLIYKGLFFTNAQKITPINVKENIEKLAHLIAIIELTEPDVLSWGVPAELEFFLKPLFGWRRNDYTYRHCDKERILKKLESLKYAKIARQEHPQIFINLVESYATYMEDFYTDLDLKNFIDVLQKMNIDTRLSQPLSDKRYYLLSNFYLSLASEIEIDWNKRNAVDSYKQISLFFDEAKRNELSKSLEEHTLRVKSHLKEEHERKEQRRQQENERQRQKEEAQRERKAEKQRQRRERARQQQQQQQREEDTASFKEAKGLITSNNIGKVLAGLALLDELTESTQQENVNTLLASHGTQAHLLKILLDGLLSDIKEYCAERHANLQGNYTVKNIRNLLNNKLLNISNTFQQASARLVALLSDNKNRHFQENLAKITQDLALLAIKDPITTLSRRLYRQNIQKIAADFATHLEAIKNRTGELPQHPQQLPPPVAPTVSSQPPSLPPPVSPIQQRRNKGKEKEGTTTEHRPSAPPPVPSPPPQRRTGSIHVTTTALGNFHLFGKRENTQQKQSSTLKADILHQLEGMSEHSRSFAMQRIRGLLAEIQQQEETPQVQSSTQFPAINRVMRGEK